ncbi:MAG: hypothetical protein P0Y56_09775 [Candidatus Andeanibacterium colombiense]|uniref:Uncharacterized protein n=1 Tax=Candidatus Andeanibacterium colombiense TaxID=3121345 RepID=A0AAJ6BLG0_9SPHN|nr:MAG: hypothetical protein P0Y56_09775 [Sphingomonadaceae bacterium]
MGATLSFTFLLILAGALLVPWPFARTFLTTGVAAMVGVLVAENYLFARSLFKLPAKRFPDRAPVAPGRSWLQALDANLRKRSWANLSLSWVIVLTISWIMYPGIHAAWWALPLWCAYFGSLIVLGTYMTFRKYQLGQRLQDD